LHRCGAAVAASFDLNAAGAVCGAASVALILIRALCRGGRSPDECYKQYKELKKAVKAKKTKAKNQII
jgi:hypothetical protein